MFIRDPPKPTARKELKVNLPAHQHRDLRALQLMRGEQAPTLVAEALDLYFQRLAAEAEAQADPRRALFLKARRGAES